MKLIEVNDKATKKDFHDTARKIYDNDPNWVCPLDIEIEGIFTHSNNKCFQHGDAIRWILKNENGELIGRIAAFYDKKKAYLSTQATGGIGFFECINDKEASVILFDNAREWLKSNGMEAMDGPINFGENFIYWGLLVDGFMQQGYGMMYHLPYYQQLFEDYGFKTYFEQYSYHKNLHEPWPERQEKFARHVGERPNFTFDHFKFSESEKYINYVVKIFNAVWSDFTEDFTPIGFDELNQMMLDAKSLIKEEFIWFGYDNGEPVCMVIVFPDANQVLKKLNGKLNLINKLRFVLNKNKISRARQMVTGCIPSHQRTYVLGAMFLKMVDAVRDSGAKELEMSWVGDYNFTVTKMYETLGLPIVKTHKTYRYLFDRNAEFKRFTNEDATKTKKMKNIKR